MQVVAAVLVTIHPSIHPPSITTTPALHCIRCIFSASTELSKQTTNQPPNPNNSHNRQHGRPPCPRSHRLPQVRCIAFLPHDLANSGCVGSCPQSSLSEPVSCIPPAFLTTLPPPNARTSIGANIACSLCCCRLRPMAARQILQEARQLLRILQHPRKRRVAEESL